MALVENLNSPLIAPLYVLSSMLAMNDFPSRDSLIQMFVLHVGRLNKKDKTKLISCGFFLLAFMNLCSYTNAWGELLSNVMALINYR
jgi:hypothetical protein